MMIFWITTALLMALALALVLPVLIKRAPDAAAPDESAGANRTTLAILRDQMAQLNAELARGAIDAEQHRVSREEIERRVLEEATAPSAGSGSAASGAAGRRPWATAAVIAVAIPLLATGAYHRLGNPAAIDAPTAAQAAVGTDGVTAEQIEAMVGKLAERMKSNPDDVQGWTLLARTYSAMQKFPQAAQAYERATALSPNDATLLADRADVMAVLQGQRAEGEPAKLIARALELDPKNLKALALSGSVAYEAGNFDLAIAQWNRALELAAPGTEFANNLVQGIKDARTAQRGPASVAGAPAAPAATGAAPAPAAQTATAGAIARVAGRVTLSPQLAAKVSPGDTVFIFAKAIEGPRMPLAIVRKTVADLPISFVLDDSMAMAPTMKLSNFPAVIVGARISKSGNAMPSPGDLSGQISGVKIGAEGLQIVIDTVQP